MYCANCGAKMEEGQSFCSACGKPAGSAGLASVAASSDDGRVARHIHIVAILWVVYSFLGVFGGLAALFFGRFWLAFVPMHGLPLGLRAWLFPLLTFVGFGSLAFAAAGFLAAWGLYERRSWARGLTLVVSILALFKFPFGTALGIYGLWVLLPAKRGEEYHRMSVSSRTA